MPRVGFIKTAAGVLAIGSSGIAAAALPSAQRAVFVNSALVYAAESEDWGVWFSTWDMSARYKLDSPSPSEANELLKLVNSAEAAGRSLIVHYDAAAGQLNEAAARIDYPLCSANLDETVFKAARSCKEQVAVALTDERRLSLGHAQARDGSPVAALELLNPAVESGRLSPAFRKIALQSRSDAFEALAATADPKSRTADAALILALADLKRVATESPDDVEAQLAVANLLRDLGDYPAAETAFKNVIVRWPDQDDRVGVSLALLARTRGENQASLDILNGIVARHGPQDGMRYNYHRGWTLNRLGRFDEAIAAFSVGLTTQPDYPWAYFYRACSYASVGRLEYALGDVDAAIGLMAKIPVPEETQDIRRYRSRAAEIQRLLRDALSAGNREPMPDTCSGFGEDGETPREKSPLLDEAVEKLRSELASSLQPTSG